MPVAPLPLRNAEPPPAALHCVSKTYDGVRALAGVDFTIAPGEVHCLMGENGSGKSTLIKLLTGVESPDRGGVVELAGRRFPAVTPAQSLELGIAVIHQTLALFGVLSVADNITLRNLVEQPWGRARIAERRRKAAAALERIGADLDLDAPVDSLPIAKRQLVAIARAVAADARLIIMDEPTASLPSHEVGRLLTAVEELRGQGVAILFVSHRLDEVMRVADRVTVLRDGRVVGSWPAGVLTRETLTQAMTGRTLSEAVAAPIDDDAPDVLRVENLGRQGEYRDISLRVRRGEVVGLGGLLGAGRTELALSLFGVTHPDTGTIEIDQRSVRFRSNRDAITHGVAYVSEDRAGLGLVVDQPISENLLLGAMGGVTRWGGWIDIGRFTVAVARWVEALGIKTRDAGLAVSTLSGGNQQRVSIGKWLARKPKLAILDSPTVGVDVGAREGLYALIRRLAEDGAGVLVISDEIEELRRVCSRVLVMRGGALVAEHHPAREPVSALEAAIHA